MCDQRVNLILREIGVELRPQHVTNPAYFKTRSALTPAQLLKEIKLLYVDENLPARHIAKRLGIDESAVRTKLRALGIKIEVRKVFEEQIIVAPNRNVKGIFLSSSEPYMVIWITPKTVTHKGRGLEKRAKAKCQWCATIFPQYIDIGPRTQKFCCPSCENRAKDYRRFLGGSRKNPGLLKRLENELKAAWRDDFASARKRILTVVPIITKKKGGTNR
jgi:DNA-binding CsgD family transcriptional regulator